jgi:hypothetical protein
MQFNKSMKPNHCGISSPCLPRNPAVAYLPLVRPMASHATSPADRGIVAHPPPEHVRISPARQCVGLSLSVVGVAAVLLGAFWASAAAWLSPVGGILMIVSVFLLSPHFLIFPRRPKRHDPYKLESHQRIQPIAAAQLRNHPRASALATLTRNLIVSARSRSYGTHDAKHR